MSRQVITFASKKSYAVGDIAVSSMLSVCMRCVAHDTDGEPLFRCITDVSELGSPGTGVIPSGLIDHARFHEHDLYQVIYRDAVDQPWAVYGYCDRVTLTQAKMIIHNAKLNAAEGFEIAVSKRTENPTLQ